MWDYTRPNPIAAGHFSAYLNRAVSKAKRIDGSYPSGLNGVNDIFSGFPDGGRRHKKKEKEIVC